MVNPAEIRAILVTEDEELVGIISGLFGQIGIAVQKSRDENEAIRSIETGRFEALVLDFDNCPDAGAVMQRLRDSGSSKNALVFAVASDGTARQRALEQGANFAFERPFNEARIKDILHTAYALMLRDRRRYFRHAVSLPVHLKRITRPALMCTSLNISRNGIAVQVPSPLEPGEIVDITFRLVQSGPIAGHGTVVWDDKHGKAGLSFECATLEDENRLTAWLNVHFYRQLNTAKLS
jgi:FixJ family two-component response regulator